MKLLDIALTGVSVLASLVILYMLRNFYKLESYEFMMIFMNAGVNKHELIRGNQLDFKHKIGTREIEIKSDRLYRVKSGKLRGFYMILRGIKQRFIVVYQDTKTEPISPPEVKVSANVLREVNESRALDKALRSEFSVPMDTKKILLIIGFVIVVIIAYVMVTGELAI